MKRALVILCGGNNQTMGTDKALLPFGKTTLLEYIVQKYSPFFDKIYLSVNQLGSYSHLGLDVFEIPDVYMNAGPMGAIFSSLTMITEDRAFFMSVANPFLDPQLGVFLLNNSGLYDICYYDLPINFDPLLCGVYTKKCIGLLAKLILLKNVSSNTLFYRAYKKTFSSDDLSKACDIDPKILFFTIKSREDYYQALSILSNDVPMLTD